MEIINAIISQFNGLTFLYCFIGAAAGVLIGAIPGLQGGTLMALILPASLFMDSILAQTLLISVYVGSVTGAMISAVLLGIPGAPAAIMTTLDGHYLARHGQAARALSLGVTASLLGAIISWLLLLFMSAPLAMVAIKFNSFDYFSMVLAGIVLIASVSEGSMLKGLIAGCFGMITAMIGLDPVDGSPRFDFGSYAMQTGMTLLAVLMGMYALAKIVEDTAPPAKAEKSEEVKVTIKDILRNAKRIKGQGKNVGRSSLIGILIGLLPGIGVVFGAIFSYTVAKVFSRTPEKFGRGSEEAIVAAECANNATVNASLVPMLSLGIPGSGQTVILLAALMVHNITPGPLLVVDRPDIFYGIISIALLANIITMAIMLFACVHLGKILKVPKHFLIPIVVALCVAGVYSENTNPFDLLTLAVFGTLGFLFYLVRVPVAPFVIGYVLAPIAEENIRSGLMASHGSWLPLLTQPVSCAFLLLSLFFLCFPFLKGKFSKVMAAKPS